MAVKKPLDSGDFQQAALDALKDFNSEEAERFEEVKARDALKERKKKLWMVCQWLLLVVCIGITIFQSPNLIAALNKKEKPIRIGTYATDERTDHCIRNLWQISKRLQEGKMPGSDLLCPAGNRPYEVLKTEKDIIVRSPNPELYGFKDLRVSKLNPVPQIVK